MGDTAPRGPALNAAPWLVFASIAGAACVHAAYLLLPGLYEYFDTDDPFFFFAVARRLAQEGRLTFDGIHLTNGVQPLWALLLAAVAWLLPDSLVEDSWRLMTVFRFVASGVSLLAGYLLFRLGTSAAGPVAGLLALFTWTLSPYIFRRDLMGFETPLYAAVLVLTILAYRRWDERPSGVWSFGLGVLLGLTVLSRLNAVFLVPIFGVAALRPRGGKWPIGEVALIASGTALMIVPYLLFNLTVFGHLMPIAGAVKQFEETRLLAAQFGDGWSLARVWYVLEVFVSTTGRLLLLVIRTCLAPGAMGTYLVAFRWHVAPSPWVVLEAIWALAMVAGTGLVALSLWRSRPAASAEARDPHRGYDFRGLGLLAVFVLADLLISSGLYPMYAPSSGYWWWFVNALVAGVLGAAVLGSMAIRRVAHANLTGMLAGLLVLALANAGLWTGYRIYVSTTGLTPRSHLMANYENVLWMNDHLPADAVVGAGNAGVAGFFFKGRLIDLTGPANSFEYLDHVRRGEIGEYVAAKGITHVLEHGTYWGWPVPIRRVLYETKYSAPQSGAVGVYEVDRDALTRGQAARE